MFLRKSHQTSPRHLVERSDVTSPALAISEVIGHELEFWHQSSDLCAQLQQVLLLQNAFLNSQKLQFCFIYILQNHSHSFLKMLMWPLSST